MLKPNVSHCVNENEVHYNPKTMADEYFTMVALESGAISFRILKSNGTKMITSISYSIDNGDTWTTTNNSDEKSDDILININVNNGDKILWKANATRYAYIDADDGGAVDSSFFSTTCNINVEGNIMSMLYGDEFIGKYELTGEIALASIFSDRRYDGNEKCKIINAENLVLPATALTYNCYCSMFWGCTSLTTAPQLPATTLADSCYSHMFRGCTSLTTAPELPATTLAKDCYGNMFQGCTSLTTAPELPVTTLTEGCYCYMFLGCTSLTTAPELPATTLAEFCYEGMFAGCTSLTTAPELPATTLAIGCYTDMFQGCTSLTTAPELPATTLAGNMYGGCYEGMFQNCTSLTTAPELPATTLAQYCYRFMFRSCTSLTTAPELPATTLASQCYREMFYGCINLNYIKAMFTTTPSDTYTANWVDGVAASGTFVKNAAAQWNVSGANGIPTGWTVETASA